MIIRSVCASYLYATVKNTAGTAAKVTKYNCEFKCIGVNVRNYEICLCIFLGSEIYRA